MENNEENRKKLATEIVDSWDMKALLNYAIEKVEEAYEFDNECFIEDCNSVGY